MRLLILLLVVIAFFGSGAAQTSDTKIDLILDAGVKPHSGIDAIYARFSEGYRQLNAKMVSDLYTDNAIYMTPDSGVDRGRENISKSFDSFFHSIKDSRGKLSISFQIIERKVSGDMAYDVGIYTLISGRGEKVSQTSKGKFVVIAIKQKGVWKFQLDSYSDLPGRKKELP